MSLWLAFICHLRHYTFCNIMQADDQLISSHRAFCDEYMYILLVYKLQIWKIHISYTLFITIDIKRCIKNKLTYKKIPECLLHERVINQITFALYINIDSPRQTFVLLIKVHYNPLHQCLTWLNVLSFVWLKRNNLHDFKNTLITF